ncbi:putative pectinesterase 67 [Carex littledalei]|uniref:Pectinesterase n=1 Tax=Carex littledalei TaxID=544730 RepID=A0A833VFN1_9POAL|nr:putative pectinesterase 67 [Carex littledalei]
MARSYSYIGGLVVLLSLCLILVVDSTVPKKPLIDAKYLNSKIQAKKTYKVGPEEEYKSVQAAIDAVPEGNSDWVIVHVKAGTYREQVGVPKNKPYIYLRGNGKGKTTIVYDQCTIDNSKSATFTVEANNFVAFGITFKNDAERGLPNLPRNQSVAAKVSGDKVAFYHCGFLSPHNTLFDHKGRHFYESCYIQGNIDFIFGRGQSLFQSCEIFVLPDGRNKILGSITAHNRKSAECNSGFIFLKGKVYGVGEVYLGRANEAHSRVIFSKTYFSKTINPVGWTNWSYTGDTKDVMIGEHDCHGPGADSKNRAEWTRQLSNEEVEPFLSIDFINGSEWLPAYY